MKELLSFIVKSIVKSPDQIKVSKDDANGVINFIITAPKDEIGIIIGQQGKTIKAIKTLLALRAKGNRFSIEVLEA